MGKTSSDEFLKRYKDYENRLVAADKESRRQEGLLLAPFQQAVVDAEIAITAANEARKVAIEMQSYSLAHDDRCEGAVANLKTATLALQSELAESNRRRRKVFASFARERRKLGREQVARVEARQTEIGPPAVCAPVCANSFPVFRDPQPSKIIKKLAHALAANRAAESPETENEIARKTCGEDKNWGSTLQQFRNLVGKNRIVMSAEQLAQTP